MKYSLEVMLKISRVPPKKGTFIIANHEGHLFGWHQIALCLRCEKLALCAAIRKKCQGMSGDFFTVRNNSWKWQEMKNAILGLQSATWMSRWKLGSMGYFTLLINGVYWGYNPLPNHLQTSWDIQVWLVGAHHPHHQALLNPLLGPFRIPKRGHPGCS